MTFVMKTGLAALMMSAASAAVAQENLMPAVDSACDRSIAAFWQEMTAAIDEPVVPVRIAKIDGNMERDGNMYFQTGPSGLPDVDFLEPSKGRGLKQLYDGENYKNISGKWLVVVPNGEGTGYRGQVFVGGRIHGLDACVAAYQRPVRIGVRELPDGFLENMN